MSRRDRVALRWHRLRVDGRAAACLEADGTPGAGSAEGRGTGRLVVFLHGWGLSHHAYRDAVRRLASSGVRVLAPALPGFGGTARLPDEDAGLEAYAAWVGAFLDAMDVDERVLLVGHSFGGGVATVAAHQLPQRVGALVLVNAIGGGTWTRDDDEVRPMADRPLWDWGVHFSSDIRHPRRLVRVLPVVLREAVPNLVLSPRAFLHAARLARDADLTAELNDIKRHGVPVVVIWSPRDEVVTEASIDALREALGDAPTITVPGGHSWLIADPEHFGEVMTNVVAVAERARWLGPGRVRRWWRAARARTRSRSSRGPRIDRPARRRGVDAG